MEPKYSIVLPALNEQAFIESTLKSIYQVLKDSRLLDRTEIIVVAATGGDSTAEIAKKNINIFPNGNVICPKGRVGKGRDVRAGMLAANGKFILFTDGDLAINVNNIPIALKSIEKNKYDVLVGIRSRFTAGRMRNIMSYFSRILIKTFTGLNFDTQCGFKVFTSNARDIAFKDLSTNGWMFDVEALRRIKDKNMKIGLHDVGDIKDPKEGLGISGEGALKAVLASVKSLIELTINLDMKSNKLIKKVLWILIFALPSLFTIAVTAANSHFTRFLHPDSYAQIQLVESFVRHGLSPISIGVTNYIYKMPIYYPFVALNIDQYTQVLILSILFSVITMLLVFVLIYWLIRIAVGEKLKPITSLLFTGIFSVYFSLISGSIFLLEYPNSRNLEPVMALLFLVYLYSLLLKFNKYSSKRKKALGILSCGFFYVLSFSDPLQLYVIGGTLILWLIFRTASKFFETIYLKTGRNKYVFDDSSKLLGMIVISGLLGKFTQSLLSNYLHFASPSPPVVSDFFLNIKLAVQEIFSAMGINDQFFKFGSMRLIGLLSLSLVAVYLFSIFKNFNVFRRILNKEIFWILLSVIVINLSIFILFLPNPSEANLGRYIINANISILVLSCLVYTYIYSNTKSNLLSRINKIILLLILVCLPKLVYNYYIKLNLPEKRYQNEININTVVNYLENNNINRVISPWGTSARISYVSDSKVISSSFEYCEERNNKILLLKSDNLTTDHDAQTPFNNNIDYIYLVWDKESLSSSCKYLPTKYSNSIVEITPQTSLMKIPKSDIKSQFPTY